jgi:two-component system, cell cycle response regulator
MWLPVLVLLPDTDVQGATAIAERIRAQIHSNSFKIQGGSGAIQVTVSIGVSNRIPGDRGAGDVFKRADLALYQAKEAGRNRVVAAAA